MTRPQEIHLRTAHLLVCTLIVIAPAFAQNQPPSETLEARNEMSSTGNYMISPAQPVVLPDAPGSQRDGAKVIDKKFIAVMAALGGSETLRFTTHKLVLDNEFAAGAPWVTSVPANQHLVAKYAAIYAAELLVAYELKKPHSWLPGDKYIRKFWWAYPAAMTTIHIKNGVRSIRTQEPAGCPPEYCEGQ
jgi:hypothetical protein